MEVKVKNINVRYETTYEEKDLAVYNGDGALSISKIVAKDDPTLSLLLKDSDPDTQIIIVTDICITDDSRRYKGTGSKLLSKVVEDYKDELILCTAVGVYEDDYDPSIFYNPIINYHPEDPFIKGKSPVPYNKVAAGQIKFLNKNNFVTFGAEFIISPNMEVFNTNFYKYITVYLNDTGKEFIRNIIKLLVDTEDEDMTEDIKNCILQLEDIIAEKSAINFNS